MAPGYTAEEKKWLKDNWGNEFHFLISYGLRIYNDEDREEGKLILRAIMEAEASASSTSQAGAQAAEKPNKSIST
ncbi:hypothetical protein EPUS_08599 [Endocarpon pusillum Z07020]|uniref:Uncharacterized protein n=1 Tax=Endocarpon pusillum (strain Z07020 / HMAS-L-300199) TaxID=1263415 RepID=U1G010_ENDPU|nr:uncharacterized protein EPUS_08599 [Endocarpon pusillum Z07020]ERF70537.1 hypothetical protein EPUS_08599 [Endocarpon pusillum Z07020]